MPTREITIINKLGLHARAAAKFVGVASGFPCQVRVGRSPDSLVDGKSIMAVMMLAAGKGTNLHLASEGVAAKVIVVEPTGAETELVVEVGGTRLIIVMHGRTAAQPDDTIHLAVDLTKPHVFDAASGQRL